LLWLSVTSQAALVNNAANIINDKKHSFQDGVMAGVKYFWPVLGLNILLKIAIYIILILISLPIISSYVQGGMNQGNALFLLFFIIFVPIAIIVSFIAKYSIAFVVLKGKSITDAIMAGWRLFANNWLTSIEMAFILLALNFAAGFVLLWLILILAVPFILIAAILSQIAVLANFWSILFLILVPLFLLIMLAGALISSFQISAWTAFYMELVSRGAVSKLQRIFSK
jgi:hypothetical protein